MKRLFSKLTLTALCAGALLSGAMAESNRVADISFQGRTDLKMTQLKDKGENKDLKTDSPVRFQTEAELYVNGELTKNKDVFYKTKITASHKKQGDDMSSLSLSKAYLGYKASENFTLTAGKMSLGRGGFENSLDLAEGFADSFLFNSDSTNNTVVNKFSTLNRGIGLGAEFAAEGHEVKLTVFNTERIDNQKAPGFGVAYHGTFADGMLEARASFHNLTTKNIVATALVKDATQVANVGVRLNLLDKALVTDLDYHYGTNKVESNDKDKVNSFVFNTMYRIENFRPFFKAEYTKVKNGAAEAGNRTGFALGNMFYLTQDDSLTAHVYGGTYTDSKEINTQNPGTKGKVTELGAGLTLAI